MNLFCQLRINLCSKLSNISSKLSNIDFVGLKKHLYNITKNPQPVIFLISEVADIFLKRLVFVKHPYGAQSQKTKSPYPMMRLEAIRKRPRRFAATQNQI